MPPTTTRAKGRCTWEPMPFDTAAGNRPTQAAKQVMATGRSWVEQAWRMASVRGTPSITERLNEDSTMMPFITEMPNRPMKPIAAETLIGVPVSDRAKMPPTMAMGMTLSASRVSVIEAKLRNSRKPIRATLTGTATSSRLMASCSSPSSPTHSR